MSVRVMRLVRRRRGMEAMQAVLLLGGGFLVVAGLRQAYKTTEPTVAANTAKALDSKGSGGAGGTDSAAAKNPNVGPDQDKLEDQVAFHEGGYVEFAYRDSEGKRTAGIGFNLDAAGAGAKLEAAGKARGVDLDPQQVKDGKQGVPKDVALDLMRAELRAAEADARAKVSNFDALSDARKRALIDMRYNMGPNSFAQFHNMFTAIEASNFDEAAKQMVVGKDGKSASDWVKEAPNRANDLHDVMQGGKDIKWR